MTKKSRAYKKEYHGARLQTPVPTAHNRRGCAVHRRSTETEHLALRCSVGIAMSTADLVGLIGILLAIGLLIWLAYRGFSLLLAGPAVSLLAAAFAGEPLLAHWTQSFMQGAGRFIVSFFPIFLLGAVFGKLMDDSGAASAIARAITGRLGAARAMTAVVLACALLTYGGVSLFVVSFAVYPIA